MKRRARWLLLLPLVLLVGVVLTPRPDELAFLGEGASAVAAPYKDESIGVWGYRAPGNRERVRVWRTPLSATELRRRISRRLPTFRWTMSSETVIEARDRPSEVSRRLAMYRDHDTGARVFVVEDLARDQRTVVVREPRGLSALPGRLRGMAWRTFGR